MNDVIVVPTYNERENIKKLVPAIFAAIPSVRVIVVDDDSPDGTAGAVRSLMERHPNLSLLLRTTDKGFGKAYIAGFTEALKDPGTRTVVMMDADLSHDPTRLPAMFEKFGPYDVVIGSRYVPGGRTEGWELWRRILSRWGNFYARTITGLPIRDCTAGFNVISARHLRDLNFSGAAMSGYAFIMELKYSLFKAGARFAEVPIVFRNRQEGESKISGHIMREGVLAPWWLRLKHR